MLNEDDYYMDNGYMVLTASFLLRRGECCHNGCVNCPYVEYLNEQKENSMSKKEENQLIKDCLVMNLVLGGPSGWWVRISDHDNRFFMDKPSAIRYLEELIGLPNGSLS